MGNYCCQRDERQNIDSSFRKKRLSIHSTTSNQYQQPDQIKQDEEEIVKILNSPDRVSMRVDCPQITNLQIISELGKGAQADVYEVQVEAIDKQSRYSLGSKRATLAIKRINLENQKKNQNSIELGTHLLIQNDCPFLIKGLFLCKNQKYLYEGMNIEEGGDLSTFLEKTTGKGDAFRKLGEYGVKLVIAGIIIALQYLHNRNLTYCDLKTENVLIGKDGYPLLSDLQLATNRLSTPICQFEGSVIGVGPQFYTENFFGRNMDLWALGVLTYTITYGEPPFSVQDILSKDYPKMCSQKENKHRLKRKTVSSELDELINSLLRVAPEQRLGSESIEEIKRHKFFKNLEWQLYEKKKLENPLREIVRKFPLLKNPVVKSGARTSKQINGLSP